MSSPTRSGLRSAQHAHRAFAAIITALLLVPTLAGCGDQPTDGRAPTSEADWELRWKACLREEGYDTGDDSNVLVTPEKQEAFDAAARPCSDRLGPAPGSEEAPSDEEQLQEALDVTTCLREHGYDVRDPKPHEPPEFPTDLSDDALQECFQMPDEVSLG